MGTVCAQRESFIDEVPIAHKKKKLSSKQKKEKIAEELKELARDINQEMHELLRSQELVIDRLDELVNNDKQGVFSAATDVFLEKAVAEIEALRAKSIQKRRHHKEQNNFLKHGCAQ
jgi:hypothetical protein